MEILRRNGGRCVELFVPITTMGRKIESVEIKPVTLDHVVRWGEGKIPTAIALLAELTGLPEASLRAIGYPDVDRVMGAFMALLPPAINNDIDRGFSPGREPTPVPAAPPPITDEERIERMMQDDSPGLDVNG